MNLILNLCLFLSFVLLRTTCQPAYDLKIFYYYDSKLGSTYAALQKDIDAARDKLASLVKVRAPPGDVPVTRTCTSSDPWAVAPNTHLVLVISCNATGNGLASTLPCSNGRGAPRLAFITLNCGRLSRGIRRGRASNTLAYTTILHEMVHALGFHMPILQTMGLVTQVNVTKAGGIPVAIFAMNSTEVLRVARRHFDCDGLDHMPLEDLAPSGYEEAHWEASVVLDELMVAAEDDDTGYHLKDYPLSALTLAALEDLTWYSVAYDKADELYFGKNATCPFVTGNCIQNMDKNVFCRTSIPELRHCSIDGLKKSPCGLELEHPARVPAKYRWFSKMDRLRAEYRKVDRVYTGLSDYADHCPLPKSTALEARACRTLISAPSDASLWGETYSTVKQTMCYVGNIGCNNGDGTNRPECCASQKGKGSGGCGTSLAMKPGLTRAYCLLSRCTGAGELELSLDLAGEGEPGKIWQRCTRVGQKLGGLSKLKGYETSYILCPDPTLYCPPPPAPSRPLIRSAPPAVTGAPGDELRTTVAPGDPCYCSGRGACLSSPGGNAVCECDPGHLGDSCEVSLAEVQPISSTVGGSAHGNGTSAFYFFAPADVNDLVDGLLNITIAGGGGAQLVAAYHPYVPTLNASDWSTQDSAARTLLLSLEGGVDFDDLLFGVLGGDSSAWVVTTGVVRVGPDAPGEPAQTTCPSPCVHGACVAQQGGGFACVCNSASARGLACDLDDTLVTTLSLTTAALSDAGQAFALPPKPSALFFLPGLGSLADIVIGLEKGGPSFTMTASPLAAGHPDADSAVWEADEISSVILIEADDLLFPYAGLYINVTRLDLAADDHLLIQLPFVENLTALALPDAPTPAPAARSRRPFWSTAKGKLAIALPVVAVLLLVIAVVAVLAVRSRRTRVVVKKAPRADGQEL